MTKKYPFTTAVILAAGLGTRMGTSVTKQQINILGKSVLNWSLSAFESAETISEIVVVTRADELDFVNKECQNIDKKVKIVVGGETRAMSAKIGVLESSENSDYVTIHDAARCLITPDEIDAVSLAAYEFGAATASGKVIDTVKLCDFEGKIEKTIDRNNLRFAKTPQTFLKSLYVKALDMVRDFDASITDDNMLLENIGIYPVCVDTSVTNIKITTIDDIDLAELILAKRKDGKK